MSPAMFIPQLAIGKHIEPLAERIRLEIFDPTSRLKFLMNTGVDVPIVLLDKLLRPLINSLRPVAQSLIRTVSRFLPSHKASSARFAGSFVSHHILGTVTCS